MTKPPVHATTWLSTASSAPHAARTATAPRSQDTRTARVANVRCVAGDTVRIVRLAVLDGAPARVHFLPGQWLDVHVPGVEQAGGFSLTCPPPLLFSPGESAASGGRREVGGEDGENTLELAIQRSPSNPAAEYFWRFSPGDIPPPPSPHATSDGGEIALPADVLTLRVGGAFVWPPQLCHPAHPPSPPLPQEVTPPPPPPTEATTATAVLVAAGMGINPLLSILTHLAHPATRPAALRRVVLLYSVRGAGLGAEELGALKTAGMVEGKGEDEGALLEGPGGGVLFLPRILRIQRGAPAGLDVRVRLFVTGVTGDLLEEEGGAGGHESDDAPFAVRFRRVGVADVERELAAGPGGLPGAVCYVCGPQGMTDELVTRAEEIGGGRGVAPMRGRVFCERWW